MRGNRTENRRGEKMTLSIIYGLNKIGILKKFRPILASDVAKAMVHASQKLQSGIYTLYEVHELAK